MLACLALPAAAQVSTTEMELQELRALVRQQAATMQALQRRLAGVEARQRAPENRVAAKAGAAVPPTRTAEAPPVTANPKASYELGAPSGSHPLTVGPSGRVPAPADRDVAVTQQPGNLPGRSVVPPYTAANVASPGAVAPIPATPVSGGGDRVRLSISGQVNRALLYGNDGFNSNVRNVDNSNSSTRFRIVGEGQINDTASGGVNVEAEFRPNASSSTTLTQNLPQPASTTTPTVRQVEAYLQDSRYGGIRLGFGSVASYLTSEVDLSGTAVASYVNVADLDGGFAFRQRNAALVPTTGGRLALSPARSYGPAVSSVFYYFDGLVRENRVRYDSPRFHGFQVSASAIDGGAFDAALRYAGEYGGNQLAAAFGFVDAIARNHLAQGAVSGFPGAAANFYGYAGVPTGANGTTTIGTAVTPSAGDVSANGSLQYDGSASLLLKSGLNFTVAGGYRDVIYRDPQGRKLSPTLLYGKVGYRTSVFPNVGISAVSLDYAQNNALQFAGDRARSYSLALVQNIDAAATELFLTGRLQSLRRTYAQYDNLYAVLLGARVRF